MVDYSHHLVFIIDKKGMQFHGYIYEKNSM
jgi:hypothetical protein